MIIRNLTANEVQVKYFGVESWIDDIEMTESKSVFAVYNDEIAEDIKQMTMRDFVKKYRAGEFEKIQDDYEDKKEEARAKEVSMKKGQELTYEEKRILGYIPKETG